MSDQHTPEPEEVYEETTDDAVIAVVFFRLDAIHTNQHIRLIWIFLVTSQIDGLFTAEAVFLAAMR